MAGVETKFDQRLAQRDSGRVLCTKRALVEGTGNGAAAQQRGSEPDALFVGEADHFDCERQTPSSFRELGDAGNRRDQPERAIPFSGIAHRIVMRPQHQARQVRPIAFIAAADVADRIEMRGHSGRSHPGEDQFGRGTMLPGEENPRQMYRRLGDRR